MSEDPEERWFLGLPCVWLTEAIQRQGRTAREEGCGGRRFVSGEGKRAVSAWKGKDGYRFLVEIRASYRQSSKAEMFSVLVPAPLCTRTWWPG